MNTDPNPFPSYWRLAIERQYQVALSENSNVKGTRAVLVDIGYTEAAISNLTLYATMSNPEIDASRINELGKQVLGQHTDTDCNCGGCKPATVDPLDVCHVFQPIKN